MQKDEEKYGKTENSETIPPRINRDADLSGRISPISPEKVPDETGKKKDVNRFRKNLSDGNLQDETEIREGKRDGTNDGIHGKENLGMKIREENRLEEDQCGMSRGTGQPDKDRGERDQRIEQRKTTEKDHEKEQRDKYNLYYISI